MPAGQQGVFWVDTPRMTDGVSQQPDSRRFRSQAEEIKNAWLTPLDGLDKRNGSIHVAKVWDAALDGNFFTHWIDIFNEELDTDPVSGNSAVAVAAQRYVLFGPDPDGSGINKFRAFDLDGTEIHIEDSASTSAGGTLGGLSPTWDYLSLGSANTVSARENYKFLTVADHTFFVNRQATVAMDSSFKTTSPAYGEAYIFVRAGNYGMDYEVLVETTTAGTTTVTSATWDGVGTAPTSPPATAGQAEVEIKTDDIAEHLKLKLDALTGVTATRVGSVVKIVGSSGEELQRVEVHDSVGDTNLEALFEEITTAVDLPLTCTDGFKIKVIGDANIGGDDYYIKFVAEESATFGRGSWEQTIAHDTEYKFDADTMPHLFVRRVGTGAALGSGYTPANGEVYFEFQTGTWGERVTGDSTLVPDPSFVGQPIENVFLVRNRLGFLADDNVVFSEVNGFFNFWRTDLANLLDSDTIDIAIGHSDVSFPRQAVGFENDLLVWTNRNEFRVPGEQELTPKTVGMHHIGSFLCDPEVTPVISGTGVYFADRNNAFSEVVELFRRGDSQLFDDARICEQVPRYIPGRIREMTASSTSNALAVVLNDPAEGNEDRLFIYQFNWTGNSRTQSAWQEWNLGADEILSANFYEDRLYVLVARNDQVYLEYIDTGLGGTDTNQDFRVKLDRRVVAGAGSYDDQTNLTRFTIPYDLAATDTVQMITSSSDSPANQVLAVSVTNRDTPGSHYVDVIGDYSSVTQIYLGVRYDMEYTFSKILVKEPTQTGEKAISSGVNQVIDGLIVFEESGPFEVEVTPRGQSAYTYEAPIRVLDDTELGDFATSPELSSGEFKFPVACEARAVTIKIRNRLPFPSKIQRAEWSVFHKPEHQRLVR